MCGQRPEADPGGQLRLAARIRRPVTRDGAYRDRTGDLRLAKPGRTFAPVRARSLKRPFSGPFAKALRTVPHPSERQVLPLLPRLAVSDRSGELRAELLAVLFG